MHEAYSHVMIDMSVVGTVRVVGLKHVSGARDIDLCVTLLRVYLP